MVFVPHYLAYFTQHNVLQFHPCCCKRQELFLSFCCIIFHYVNVSQFWDPLILSIVFYRINTFASVKSTLSIIFLYELCFWCQVKNTSFHLRFQRFPLMLLFSTNFIVFVLNLILRSIFELNSAYILRFQTRIFLNNSVINLFFN